MARSASLDLLLLVNRPKTEARAAGLSRAIGLPGIRSLNNDPDSGKRNIII